MKEKAKKVLIQEEDSKDRSKPGPPSKIKLADALQRLLIDKNFNAITTAEIARTANANEALIYRYFGDKRGLLHYVLDQYMREALESTVALLDGAETDLEKLKRWIWSSLNMYNNHRVFAKIILVEVRNYPGFFESDTHALIREYSEKMSELIQGAIKNGDIRNDVPVNYIRNAIIGAMEHLALPSVLFGRQFSPNVLSENVYKIVLEGVQTKK